MFWLRACHRCGGDLTEDGFGSETYVNCVQCGGILRPEQEAALRSATRKRRAAEDAA